MHLTLSLRIDKSVRFGVSRVPRLLGPKTELNRVNLLSISTAASGQGRKIPGTCRGTGGESAPAPRQAYTMVKFDSLVLL